MGQGGKAGGGGRCRHWQPARLTHFDHHDQTGILIKSGERTAQVINLGHGGNIHRLHRPTMMPNLRRSPHSFFRPQMSYVGRTRAASGLGGRDERLQQAELIITQGLAGPIIPDQRAIFRRPPGDLQAGNLLKRRKLGPSQSITSATPIFQNGV